VYANGHVYTQTIEGFFGNVKNGIAGELPRCIRQVVKSYINEYAWRYNHRNGRAMFVELVRRAAEVEPYGGCWHAPRTACCTPIGAPKRTDI
jgi:hypothetical protein